MSWKPDILGETGLQFFGKMSASISHEIKNALAIINESAGLLEDLTVMAAKGMPIDPEKLKTTAGRVMKQVRRADGIVKNMNRFAHSVDESLKSVDLCDVLVFMGALAARSAAMRGVSLDVKPTAGPVTVHTNPFLLENLIWLCLDFAMEVAGTGKIVGMVAGRREKGAEIRFIRLDALGEAVEGRFPGEKEKALLQALKSETAVERAAGKLILTLPEDVSR
jgi:C4-dicarboxylate-specific signal transduction histidine kinase